MRLSAFVSSLGSYEMGRHKSPLIIIIIITRNLEAENLGSGRVCNVAVTSAVILGGVYYSQSR